MDAAYLNRIDAVFEVSAMPHSEEQKLLQSRAGVDEKTAIEIVGIARELRSTIDRQQLDVDASTRTALKVARFAKFGMPIKKAFEYVVLNTTNTEDRKSIVDILNRDGYEVEDSETTGTHVGNITGVGYVNFEMLQQIRRFLSAEKKIDAIKYLREQTKCGLKEAKEFIESI